MERLSAAGAKVIGFDFTFGALEREAAHNKRFAAAMKKAGNVVFGYEFTNVGDPSPPGSPASEVVQANALARFKSAALPPAPSLIEPEPALAEAAVALGHVRTVAGDDGKIRVLPLLIQHGGKAYPSLALQLARVYMDTPLEQVHDEGGVVRMGALDIPVSPSGEVLLNWPAGRREGLPPVLVPGRGAGRRAERGVPAARPCWWPARPRAWTTATSPSRSRRRAS